MSPAHWESANSEKALKGENIALTSEVISTVALSLLWHSELIPGLPGRSLSLPDPSQPHQWGSQAARQLMDKDPSRSVFETQDFTPGLLPHSLQGTPASPQLWLRTEYLMSHSQAVWKAMQLLGCSPLLRAFPSSTTKCSLQKESCMNTRARHQQLLDPQK